MKENKTVCSNADLWSMAINIVGLAAMNAVNSSKIVSMNDNYCPECGNAFSERNPEEPGE